MLRQDLIKRLIEQLAQFLARITRLVSNGELDKAAAELESAKSELGLLTGIERLDARSAATILGGGDKVVLAAALLEQEARIATERGHTVKAARLIARARELLARAQPVDSRALADELARKLSP